MTGKTFILKSQVKLPHELKKNTTPTLAHNFPNVDHLQNSFTVGLNSKRTMKKIPSYLKCITTL